MSDRKQGMNPDVQKAAGSYLFNEGSPENWQNLEVRTHIPNERVYKAQLFMGSIKGLLGSRATGVVLRIFLGSLLSLEPEPLSRPKMAVQVLQNGMSTQTRNLYREVEPVIAGDVRP